MSHITVIDVTLQDTRKPWTEFTGSRVSRLEGGASCTVRGTNDWNKWAIISLWRLRLRVFVAVGRRIKTNGLEPVKTHLHTRQTRQQEKRQVVSSGSNERRTEGDLYASRVWCLLFFACAYESDISGETPTRWFHARADADAANRLRSLTSRPHHGHNRRTRSTHYVNRCAPS